MTREDLVAKIKTLTKNKNLIAQANRLDKEGKNLTASMSRILSNLPSGGYKDAC